MKSLTQGSLIKDKIFFFHVCLFCHLMTLLRGNPFILPCPHPQMKRKTQREVHWKSRGWGCSLAAGHIIPIAINQTKAFTRPSAGACATRQKWGIDKEDIPLCAREMCLIRREDDSWLARHFVKMVTSSSSLQGWGVGVHLGHEHVLICGTPLCWTCLFTAYAWVSTLPTFIHTTRLSALTETAP